MPAGTAPPGDPATEEAPPHSLRGLLAALLELLHTRLDLAAVDLEIYLLALVRMLLLALGAVACALLALTFGLIALVVALWDAHRMLALIGGSVLFVALALICAWLAARTLRHHAGVLAGSLAQLREDQRRLRGAR